MNLILFLEISYPTIRGILPSRDLGQTIIYIFNFALAIVGILALFALILASLKYIQSGGNPQEKTEAKERIKSAFLGILILLLSYIVLKSLHPAFLLISPSEIQPQETTTPLPLPPEAIGIIHPQMQNPLQRIGSTTEEVIKTGNTTKNEMEKLWSLLQTCNCQETNSECGCVGLSCTAFRCFGDPCPRRKEIEKTEKEIAKLAMVSFYLGNLLNFERETIVEDGNLTKWAERVVQNGFFSREELLEISNLLNQIYRKLMEENRVINEGLLPLPSQCTAQPCHPSCSGACHDDTSCSPNRCSGPNPCPLSQIREKINQISRIIDEISGLISILNSLIRR
jgi:hypothetical protein